VDALEVRTYRADDAPRVIALLRAAFGDWPGRRVAAHARPEEFFRWKHERNPHGPSYILLAEADHRLVGMRAYMPWPLHVNGGERMAAVQGVDIATHPEFRGHGISSEMLDAAIETLRDTKSFSLGLPNPMSTSQGRRKGWQEVGRLTVWVKVRRALRVVHRAGALKTSGRSLAVPSLDAPTANQVLAEPAGVAGLLSQSRLHGPRFATDLDVDYLRWRYEPMLGDYHAVTEYDGGALVGLAIFGVRQRGELWEGSVCELFVRAGDHRTARCLLRQVAQAGPLDYLAAVPPANSELARTLVRAGFVPSPVGGRRIGLTPYNDHLRPDPLRRDSWSLSFGDLERLDLC
jgi:GNAT superfamily N-acetyltransferase